jgi:hypothetical protein
MAPVALVHTGGAPAGSPRLREAEARLAEVLAQLDALDAEVEALTRALEAFGAAYEEALGEAYAEADGWERTLRRLRTLQDEVARLTRLLEPGALPPRTGTPGGGRAPHAAGARSASAATSSRTASGTPGRRDGPGGEAEEGGEEEGEGEAPPPGEEEAWAEAREEDEALLLKRLHRRLARVLHPDLAATEPERERLGGLMAQVNHAYETGDRTLLELMAARLGAGEALEGVTEEDRVAHLERRARTLATAAASLRQQRERLRGTATGRLHEEAQRRAAQGGDYLSETREELAEEAHAMAADVRARMAQLERAARALTHARSRAISALTGSDKRKLRVFDPVLESALVRRGATRLERQRATDRARALARDLEDGVARGEPWGLWLTLMAFFAEAAGRPPPGLATAAAWEERWEALRTTAPEAPAYAQALTRLPRHLEMGLRLQKQEVRFGVQLRELELLAAVPLALERAEVAEQGRLVLSVLGPREACKACGADGYLVHLLRTRGLDERHGMVCGTCGKAAKSYWLYAKTDGQEALLPRALELGLVTEVVLRFAGAGVAFQLLPGERDALTADALRQRFVDLYVTPYGLELDPAHLVLSRRGAPLPGDAPLGEGVVSLQLAPEAGQADKDVLALLRSRIERRFRPDGKG